MGYAETALEREFNKLTAAQPGTQDNTINEVLFCLAGMVKGGWFDEHEVRSRAFSIIQALPASGKPFTRNYCEAKWKNAYRNAQARVLPAEPGTKQNSKHRYSRKPNANGAQGSHSIAPAERYPKASIDANELGAEGALGGRDSIPDWTPPDEEGKPLFTRGDTLPKQVNEMRRHLYVDANGRPRRLKIKLQKQNGETRWVDWYRVKNRRCEGWQARRPAAYAEIPFYAAGETINPFTGDDVAANLFWTEGEKDVESMARNRACAFTFGGSSTFINACDLVRGRHLVLLGDNDEAGRKWAAKQASIVAHACASIKTYTFPQLDDKGDASDFLANHSIEELEAIIAQLPEWRPDFGYGGELLTDTIAQPPVMLVNRLVPAQGLIFAGGQSESGKTYAMVALAIAIASGGKFCGFNVYHRAAIIYCAAEGEGVLNNRFSLAKAHMQAQGELPILILKTPGYINDNFDAFRRDMRQNADWLKRHFNLFHCVFILDTRIAGWRMEDENDAEEAGEVCAAVRSLGPEIGGPVIIVHHYGKDKERGLRGSSAWEAGCDHVISIYAQKDTVTGEVSKREIAIARSRFGPTGTIGEFELKYEKLGIGPHDEEFGDCYIEFLGPSNERPKMDMLPKAKGRPKGGRGDLILEQAINNALAEAGQLRAVGITGPLVNAVKLQRVRDNFYQRYITGETSTKDIFDVQRKAWTRAIANIDGAKYGTEKEGEIEWIWKI